ncbi:MAG: alginate O-acetyltransferase [Gammaproteobacteria bacterium]
MTQWMNRWSQVQSALFAGALLTLGGLAAMNARSFRLPGSVDLLNGSLAKAFETQYDELFPVKTLGVNLWAAIDYTVFIEGRPGIVIGKEDWLYTDEEFNVGNDYHAHLRDNLALIVSHNSELASSGVQLVVAVVPAKARVYPELLGSRRPARAHLDLYDTLLARLADANIPTADLRNTLIAGKLRHPTYFRTDTHWTPWGAQLAAREVAAVVRSQQWARTPGSVYVTRLDRTILHRGDLLGFLPLEPYFAQLLPQPETVEVMRTEVARSKGDALRATEADLFGDAALPEVVLVGTSYAANPLWNFAGYLEESLHEAIVNYAREGGGPFQPMAAYLRSEDFSKSRPRLVIWEIPERALLSAASVNAPNTFADAR